MVELLLVMGCWSEPPPPPLTPEQLALQRLYEVIGLDEPEIRARRVELEQRLLTEPEPIVREALAAVLTYNEDPASVPVLTEVLASDPYLGVQRQIALGLLLDFPQQEAIDAAVAWYLRGVDPAIEVEGLGYFAGTTYPRVVCCSLARLNHIDPERADQIRARMRLKTHQCRTAELVCPANEPSAQPASVQPGPTKAPP